MFTMNLHHKGIDRASYILQHEWSKLVECKVEPVLHMVANGTRDANPTRRALGLEFWLRYSLRHRAHQCPLGSHHPR